MFVPSVCSQGKEEAADAQSTNPPSHHNPAWLPTGSWMAVTPPVPLTVTTDHSELTPLASPRPLLLPATSLPFDRCAC